MVYLFYAVYRTLVVYHVGIYGFIRIKLTQAKIKLDHNQSF